MNKDIAAAVERGITGQTDLVTTLSVAVIGGLLASLLQLRMHNARQDAEDINLQYPVFLILGLLFAGGSVALSYLITGTLIEISPQLFKAEYNPALPFTRQDFGPAPIELLRRLSFLQFSSFCISIVCSASFVWTNRK